MKHLFFVTVAAQAISLLILITPSIAQQPNPSDFAVPRAAFSQFSLTQFAGGIRFQSRSFSSWLERTGKFGELVSLGDTRNFESQAESKGEYVLEGGGEGDGKSSIPKNRICDIAYLLLRVKYDAEPLSYRDKLEKRDKLISALVLKIKTPAENREVGPAADPPADNQ